MSESSALFEFEPKYCIDTNVIVSFMHEDDGEIYRRDVFTAQWNRIETLIGSGEIAAPRRVETELRGWEKQIPDMKRWLDTHGMFIDMTTAQLAFAKRVVNTYPDYSTNVNYLGDLEVISLAGARGIAVITGERVRPVQSINHPKIPEVCKALGIECLSTSGFLAKDAQSSLA